MNVCIIAYTFYELDYRVRRYAEALVELGNKVNVISLRRKGEKCQGVLNGVNIIRIQKRSYEEKGIFSYFLKYITFFIKGSLILIAKYVQSRYKIIHIHNVPDVLIFMGIVPKFLGAKLILDIHDILPEFYCQKFNKSLDSSLAKSLLFVEKISVRFADHVIAANDLWREKIIARDKILPETCTTLLNYPNMAFFNNTKAKSKKTPFTIIYPGTISHLHGLDILIRAMSIVKEKLSDARLDIYARTNNLEYSNFLKKLIDSLHLRENVRFFNPVPIEELTKIYSNADIGVAPKRGGVFASEAFSTKIFDFMAASLPVIASKTTIDQYYFDDSMIYFFESENHEDMARCIIELYNNSEKRQSLIKHGKQFIATNNWEIKKQKYLEIVDYLAEDNRK